MKLKVGGDKKNRAEYTNRTVSDLKLSIKRMGGRGKKRRQSTVHLNQINHTDRHYFHPLQGLFWLEQPAEMNPITFPCPPA